MQVAIFLILILIACLLAPWLLGVLLAFSTAYFMVLVVVAGCVIICLVGWLIYLRVKPTDEQKLQRRAARTVARARRNRPPGQY